MHDNFLMEIAWHNCANDPPKEKRNLDLYATDGQVVFRAAYGENTGWYNVKSFKYLPDNELVRYWWADINRAVKSENRFNA